MSVNELMMRRGAMMQNRGGGGIDWESIAKGMCDFTTSFEIPSDVGADAKAYAYYGRTNLTSIIIKSGVTTLGNSAFYNCTNLASITLPDTLTTIGLSSFYGCRALTGITNPSSVTTISNGAFGDCRGLTSIDFPSGVTTIATQMFYDCRGLLSFTVKSTVTSIGVNAFGNCNAMAEMIFDGTTPPTLGGATNSLGATSATWPIYVPDSAVSAYQTAFANYSSRIKGISERPTT